MTRVNAALLAGVVTILLVAAFAALFGLLDGTILERFQAPLFVLGVIVFVIIVPIAQWRMRRTKRHDELAKIKPLPASERLKTPRAF